MSARRILHSSRTLLVSARRRSITHDGVLRASYNNSIRPEFTYVSKNGVHFRGISASSPIRSEKGPAATTEGEDDDPCPEWQNPLHHNNPEFQKVLAEDFAPGDEMPTVPLPPFSSPDGGIDAPPHIHELAEEIIHLNMIELKSLMDRIGDHFGFDEGGGYDDSEEGGADEGGGEEVKEEKTTWDLRLEAFDAKSKIKVIKEIRSVTGLGLKEAKELVEGAPTAVKKDIKMEEAQELKAKLEASGATVSIA